MNSYLDENNKPTEILFYTLNYYGISLDEFKQMTDIQVQDMVKNCSDVLNDGKNHKSGGGNKTRKIKNKYFGHPPTVQTEYPGGDSGSFSRFFSLDSWWNKHEKELPEIVRRNLPFLIVGKASPKEKNRGCSSIPEEEPTSGEYSINKPEAIEKRRSNPKKQSYMAGNTHPTVKPIKLFSYLVMLGTRPSDVVLDPFASSGTTAIVCEIENRDYIMIENNKKHYKILKTRVKFWRRLAKLENIKRRFAKQ